MRVGEDVWLAMEVPQAPRREIRKFKSGWMRNFKRGEAVYQHSEEMTVQGYSGRGGGFVGWFLCTDREMKEMDGLYEPLYDKVFSDYLNH